MICYKCRKQIPDDSLNCPHCGLAIEHHEQLPKEILLRRYQRWFFYGVICFLFLGMVGVILKIYNTNTELLLRIANVHQTLEEKEAALTDTASNLEQARQTLAASREQLTKAEFDLNAKAIELNQKTEEFRGVLEEKEAIISQLESRGADIEQLSLKLADVDTSIYSMMVSLGTGMSNHDLSRIPLADWNLGEGLDSDGDGLSDVIERALGTDPYNPDTDGDGYDDKSEVLNGFNPLGPGSLPIDRGFADNQKGKILLQVEASGEAWYVNPADGKRYFLGKPAEAIRALANLGI